MFKSLPSPQEDRFYEYWKKAKTGYRLRKQYKIMRFFADFAHPASHVVIEIDGHAYHSTRLQKAQDHERQILIERQGWKVIRFPGWRTQDQPEKCVQEALEMIQSRLLR